eukprot:2846361-Alexandrium_andersonii.AAC.1
MPPSLNRPITMPRVKSAQRAHKHGDLGRAHPHQAAARIGMKHAARLTANLVRAPSTVLQLFGHPHLTTQPRLRRARDEPPVATCLDHVRS